MSQNQGDFTPVVKGGYKSDDAFHRRNWKHLSDFLRSNFVTSERLADGSVKEPKIDNLAVTDAKHHPVFRQADGWEPLGRRSDERQDRHESGRGCVPRR